MDEDSFVAEFENGLADVFGSIGGDILAAVKADSNVPVGEGTLRDSIEMTERSIDAYTHEIDLQATAEHAGILDSGIEVRPIVPVNRRALAGPGFGPVASANPGPALDRYRGWWDRATADTNIDPILDSAIRGAFQ